MIQRRTAIQPNSTLGFVILLLDFFVDEHADINLIYTVYILYTCIVVLCGNQFMYVYVVK